MSTNRVTVTEQTLVIEPAGWSRPWSFTGRLEIPFAHVRGATFDPGMRDEPKGWRGLGLRVPGRVSGTLHADGGRQFWNVSGYDRAIVITLDPEDRFDRVVITVDDPEEVARAINGAISPRA